VTNHSKSFKTLLGLVFIAVAFFLGFSGDSLIFGYTLINLFYFFVAVGIIISIIWYLLRNKSKISINTLKQGFNSYISAFKNVRKLPDSSKNTVLMGYLSILLIFMGEIVGIFTKILYGTLNGHLEGALTVFILFPGMILFFYSMHKMYFKEKCENKQLLQTHFNLIWNFFIICLFLNIVLIKI
jgi:hypothetical protein